jgi:hypothetical protein
MLLLIYAIATVATSCRRPSPLSSKLTSLRVLKSISGGRRSQWPTGLRHELSSLDRVLGSWVWIPLKLWVSVLCAEILCVGRGLATGWYIVQGVLPTVYRIKKLKKRPRPKKGPFSNNNNKFRAHRHRSTQCQASSIPKGTWKTRTISASQYSSKGWFLHFY